VYTRSVYANNNSNLFRVHTTSDGVRYYNIYICIENAHDIMMTRNYVSSLAGGRWRRPEENNDILLSHAQYIHIYIYIYVIRVRDKTLYADCYTMLGLMNYASHVPVLHRPGEKKIDIQHLNSCDRLVSISTRRLYGHNNAYVSQTLTLSVNGNM